MSARLAIVFHFHEPLFVDPASGRAAVPWVRLRAIKDYYGAVALLRRFEKVRITATFSPCLLQQLNGEPDDDYASLALKRPRDLTREEVAFILDRFFHEGLVERFERYRELRDKKESGERFGQQDLRDLQVLSTLAWVHPLAFHSNRELASLKSKGSSFTERDKRALFDACAVLVREIVPAFLELSRSGRVELATSAYHHPVLPLLCSPPVVGAPDATDDAREQLARAKESHERAFGAAPGGLWPPELALDEPALSLVTEAGFGWTVADEGGLGEAGWQHLHRVHERDGTAVLFRDRQLSELVARGSRGVRGRAAAAELVSRILRIGDAAEDAVVTLALDGARTWNSHGGGGVEFLDSLFEFLTREARVSTCTVLDAVSGGRRSLEGLRRSSWAPSGDLSPWSDEGAWRELLSAREKALGGGRARAREALFAAEASDWFAAVKDESTPLREEYLALFRAHLECAAATTEESRVASSGGGLLAAMSYRLEGGVLAVEVEPAEGREAELAQRRLELRLVEPVEARIAVAGLEAEKGRLFACDIEGRPRGRPVGEARMGSVLALKVPLEALGAAGGDEVAFYFAVIEEEKVTERLPPRGPAWVAPGRS